MIDVNEKKISVIIADDLVSTRRALKALLAYEPRIEVIGEVGDGQQAVRLVGELLPDLILLDVKMPVLDGIEATQKIKANWPSVKVVVYTMFPGYQKEAYLSGADYFLIKGSQELTLAQVILSFFTAPHLV
jgi:DNA-binding NarL/FixJ family response regulator